MVQNKFHNKIIISKMISKINNNNFIHNHSKSKIHIQGSFTNNIINSNKKLKGKIINNNKMIMIHFIKIKIIKFSS